MILRSGQGVWAFWFLRDSRIGKERFSPRANRMVIPWAESIQQHLHELFAELGADRQATDLCRLMRMPGSVNTKTDVRTSYWLQGGPEGTYTYTLEELDDFWGIGFRDRVVRSSEGPRQRLLRGGMDPKAMARRRWERNLEMLVLVFRNVGVREGNRGKAMYLAVTFLSRLGIHGDELRAEAEKFFKQLDQSGSPYTRQQFERALRTESSANPSHQMIADYLNLKPEDVHAFNLDWPVAQQYQHLVEPPPKTRKQKKAERISMWEAGNWKTPNEFLTFLKTWHPDLKCSPTTIYKEIPAQT